MVLWKLFLLLIIQLAHANSLEDYRWNLNENYANFLYGKCGNIKQCPTGSDPLSELSLQMLALPLNENSFFQSAAADQVNFLTCDIEQLKSLSSKSFQEDILEDLTAKLPLMRTHYQQMQISHGKLSELQKKMDSFERTSARFAFPGLMDQERKEVAQEIEKESAIMAPHGERFNSLLSSLWRSEDPAMNEFIMKILTSEKSLGTIDFSFKEQVLDKMANQAVSDLETLKKQSLDGKGLKFSSDALNLTTKKMLIKNSEWSEYMGNSSDAAQFMCQLDHRYVSGDEATVATIDGATLLVSGVGAAAKLLTYSKYLRLMSPMSVKALLQTSRVLSFSSTVATSVNLINEIKNNCWDDRPANYYKKCDPSQLKNAATFQKEKIESENCSLSLAMAAAGYAPLALTKLASTKIAKNIALKAKEFEVARQRYPAITHTLKKSRQNALKVTIKRNSDLDAQILSRVPDPAFKKGFAVALEKMHDPKVISDYIVKLQEDAFALMYHSKDPKLLKMVEKGELDSASIQNVLRNRAESKGAGVTEVNVILLPDEFEKVLKKGFIIDKAFDVGSEHGIYTHFVQQDMIYDIIASASGKSHKEVVSFFGSKNGIEVFQDMLDLEGTHLKSPMSPEWFNENFIQPHLNIN